MYFKIKKDANLSKPVFKDGVYDNPWSTWKFPSMIDLLRWRLFETDQTNLPKDTKVSLKNNDIFYKKYLRKLKSGA